MAREQASRTTALVKRRRPPIAAPGERHLLFVATALALGLGLGFVLAILLPLAVALQASWGLRWQALAQVHGHVQVVGFAGFFVIGMAYRLVPRFSGAPLRHAWTALPVYALLLAGLLLRTVGQPTADNPLLRWMPAMASLCELGGAGLFCLAVLPPLRRPLLERQPWAPFLAAGALWFVVQAAFGVWFLTDVSRFPGPFHAVAGGRGVLPEPRDRLLITLQVYGFLLCFIFGVASRAVPTFFAHQPSPRLQATVWLLLQLGLCLLTAEALMFIWHNDDLVWLNVGGLLCLGGALIGLAATTGSWKAASRLRGTARPAAGLITAAFFWCAVAGVLNLVFAVQAWAGDRPLPGTDADAVRHVVTVGVVTTLIVGMAHLVVPALATQRLAGKLNERRLLVLKALLAAAVLFRVVPPLLPDLGAKTRDGLIGTAGLLAWLAIALFAWWLMQSRRRQDALIAELTPVFRHNGDSEPATSNRP